VTATGADLKGALERAYAAVDKIHFEGMHFRRDIGAKGLKRVVKNSARKAKTPQPAPDAPKP